MTVPTYATATATDQRDAGPVGTPAEEPGCPACPHPLAGHDPIGARFCRATSAGAADRGCICRIG